ncbi:WbqC family protein [Erythrobacter ani]|uniref:WbqC family protein n=1 Tax=Erythrobacter ani TaxID=2827235 RepID=A0ABS6SIJ4_9SPHN|nr:WbqC family protein [Erythrobacter ani]MBV7264811.1 WbqC family protein [Erythrobacter ani]
MISAIMQPTYLPWIGYFDLIDSADTFVFLDDAQVLKRSWGVRNRILCQNGETYLTVPLVGHSQQSDSTFANTAIDPGPKWMRTHLATIRHAYAKAPHFADVFGNLEALMSAGHKTIGALNMDFITSTARKMGIDTPFAQSSCVEDAEGRKDDRLLAICRAIGSDHYIAAQGSADYIEREHESGAFAGSGVDLRYHNFVHPHYPQTMDVFTSHMSIVDLLVNCGYPSALEIIRSGRRAPLTSFEMKKEQA